MKWTTIVFLVRHNSILLAMKKRGHGAGKWNGAGGKLLDDETSEQAATRESKEEIGVTPTSLKEVGEIEFIFPPELGIDHVSTVYLCDKWDGEPIESEEMLPKWFKVSEIPYDEMWESDATWLPKVLQGKKIKARVVSGKDNELVSYEELPSKP